MLKRTVIAFAALAVIGTTAFAQTAQPATLDISFITTPIIHALFILLSGVATWAGVALRGWLAKRTQLANTELAMAIQKQYNEAIARSMAYAETYATTHISDAAGQVQINNQFIKLGVDYAKKFWPDLTKGMDFDAIARTIVARLPTGPASETAEIVAAGK